MACFAFQEQMEISRFFRNLWLSGMPPFLQQLIHAIKVYFDRANCSFDTNGIQFICYSIPCVIILPLLPNDSVSLAFTGMRGSPKVVFRYL